MKRTISLKLILLQEHEDALRETQGVFSDACNKIVPFAVEHRCWNSVNLHHHSYCTIREQIPSLGSQMACNAIKKVCSAYKVLKIQQSQDVKPITFRKNGSTHYDKRTYSLKGNVLSLVTVTGRIRCSFCIGPHQAQYLKVGRLKEGELIKRGNCWFFNLVVELPNIQPQANGTILAVDVGETNLATTSNGTIHGGGRLRHKRDKFLARRRKLQSNGSRSAKRCLQRISGRERRHVKAVNHRTSKAIIEEAVRSNAKDIRPLA